jgi:glycosyltransferase involved in cell wall biosynthesis
LTSPLRICFVAGDLASGGGVNRVIGHLSEIFAERLGAAVNVLAIGSTGTPTYPISDKVNIETASGEGPIGWREALSRVRRQRPDFVIGSWAQSNVVLILALLLSGTRVVVVEHTSWYFHPRRVRALRRLIYPLAWRVVVLNPSELAHYRTYLRNVRLLPNPVPAAAGASAGGREKLIVAIGHLEARKNFADAIRAMALSRLEESGWGLSIIGAGPEEGALRRAIGDCGLTRTRVHPPAADLAPWYDRASLTLVTATLEVFSLALAEAMSAGVVPVAYVTDGPSYILEDFPDHLVPIGDVAALAERMRRFAGEDDAGPLRTKLAESIETRFSPEVVADEWRRLFNESD